MEAVLPLKIRPDGRAPNLAGAAMLCRSLARFWQGPSPLVLTVMSPAVELAAIREALAPTPPHLLLRFVPETELVPKLDANPAFPGWMRQQVLKLAAFTVTQSDFYLCLDADVLCVKPIDPDLLLPGGKALTDYGSRLRHADWWRASAALLGVAPDLDRPGMRVTPAILNRSIVEGLYRALTPGPQRPSWLPLMQTDEGSIRGWTEYTLYHVFAENAGLMGKHHLTYEEFRALDRPLIGGGSVWSSKDPGAWDPSRVFDVEDKGLFVVLQSSARPPPAHVWRSLQRHLDAPRPGA